MTGGSSIDPVMRNEVSFHQMGFDKHKNGVDFIEQRFISRTLIGGKKSEQKIVLGREGGVIFIGGSHTLKTIRRVKVISRIGAEWLYPDVCAIKGLQEIIFSRFLVHTRIGEHEGNIGIQHPSRIFACESLGAKILIPRNIVDGRHHGARTIKMMLGILFVARRPFNVIDG